MPPSWIVTGCLTGRGLVQRRGRDWGEVFSLLLPLPPCPFSPLNPYSLGEYLLAPILRSYWIQDGGLIWECALARPKYACIAGYWTAHLTNSSNTNKPCWSVISKGFKHDKWAWLNVISVDNKRISSLNYWILMYCKIDVFTDTVAVLNSIVWNSY